MSEEINYDRRRFLGAAGRTLAAAKFVIIGSADAQPRKINPAIEGELPSLGSATEWLTSQPLTAVGLRGKVVLVDFWGWGPFTARTDAANVCVCAPFRGKPRRRGRGILDPDSWKAGETGRNRLPSLFPLFVLYQRYRLTDDPPFGQIP